MIILKFVPDWFVTIKMLEKRNNSIFSNDDMFFHDVDANIITFLTGHMGFNTIDLNKVNLDDDDDDDDDDTFDDDYSEIINHV